MLGDYLVRRGGEPAERKKIDSGGTGGGLGMARPLRQASHAEFFEGLR